MEDKLRLNNDFAYMIKNTIKCIKMSMLFAEYFIFAHFHICSQASNIFYTQICDLKYGSLVKQYYSVTEYSHKMSQRKYFFYNFF